MEITEEEIHLPEDSALHETSDTRRYGSHKFE